VWAPPWGCRAVCVTIRQPVALRCGSHTATLVLHMTLCLCGRSPLVLRHDDCSMIRRTYPSSILSAAAVQPGHGHAITSCHGMLLQALCKHQCLHLHTFSAYQVAKTTQESASMHCRLRCCPARLFNSQDEATLHHGFDATVPGEAAAATHLVMCRHMSGHLERSLPWLQQRQQQQCSLHTCPCSELCCWLLL
jgi:hypothetical protein